MWACIVYTHTIITSYNTYIHTNTMDLKMYTVYALCILTHYIPCNVHILSAQTAQGLFVLRISLFWRKNEISVLPEKLFVLENQVQLWYKMLSYRRKGRTWEIIFSTWKTVLNTQQGEITATFSSTSLSQILRKKRFNKVKVARSYSAEGSRSVLANSLDLLLLVEANRKNESIRKQENEQLVLTLCGMLD